MSLNPLRRRSAGATEVRDDVRDDVRRDVRDDVRHDDRLGDRRDDRDLRQPDVDRPRAGRHADDTVLDDTVLDDTVPDGPRPADTPTGRIDRDAPTVVDRDAPRRIDRDAPSVVDRTDAVDRPLDRAAVVAREKAAFGGLKIGSAFFGWLAAMGTAVLLSAIVAAAITAVRVASGEGATDPATIVAGAGVGTDVAIVAILFVAYYCGGYVAGRMARFDGAKQGLAVWVLALVAALLITALGSLAGADWDLLGTLNGFPRLQDAATTVTAGGVVTTLIALAAALVGAVLGGLAGMRFHRRVDRAGLGA